MKKKIDVVLVGIGHDHAHFIFTHLIEENSDYNLLGIYIEENTNGFYDMHKKEYEKFTILSENDLYTIKVDAAFIESDDRLLTKLAMIFAHRNIPIHMDKPGGQNKEEFDELIATCKKNNVPLHLGYMYRYNPLIKEAFRIARSGAFGKIYGVNAEMSIRHPESKKDWLNNFNGGMMNFLGCHLIDVIICLLGKPDSVIPYNYRTREDKGEDMGFAILRYGNSISTVNTNCVEIGGYQRRHITIVGENLTIDIAPTEIGVRDYILKSKAIFQCEKVLDGVPVGEVVTEEYDRYQEMIDEFTKIIRKEIAPVYTLEHEQLVHDVLLAACGEYGKEVKLWKQY